MPKMEKARPTSGGGTVASGALKAAMNQDTSPRSADRIAPALFARRQQIPAASGQKADTRVTVYAFCTMSYIVCFELSAKISAAAVNEISTRRRVRRNCRSLMRG